MAIALGETLLGPYGGIMVTELKQNPQAPVNAPANAASHTFAAVVRRETLSDGEVVHVAECPQLDVVSQGASEAQALRNLVEAVDLVREFGGQAEIEHRLQNGARLHW